MEREITIQKSQFTNCGINIPRRKDEKIKIIDNFIIQDIKTTELLIKPLGGIINQKQWELIFSTMRDLSEKLNISITLENFNVKENTTEDGFVTIDFKSDKMNVDEIIMMEKGEF